MTRLLAFFALLAMTSASFAADAKTASRIVDEAIANYIQPGYAAFSSSASALETSVQGLCEGQSVKTRNVMRRQFSETVNAWSKVEFIRFGPVREQNRLERILFFPDRRGTMLRQVQALTASKDPAALEPRALQAKSVAVQGLPALEFILFGNDGTIAALDDYDCALAETIAANLSEIAKDIDQAWQAPDGIINALRNPGPENDHYRNADETLTEILKILTNGYELIVETRLAPFVGDTIEKAKPKRALFWRSRMTRSTLIANLEGLNLLAETSGVIDDLPEDAKTQILRSFPFENRNALQSLQSFRAPLSEEVQTQEGRGKLAYLQIVIRSLYQISLDGIMAGYGLVAGFSSLDGD